MRMSPGALAAWANGRAPLAANAPRRARRRVLAANPGQAAPPKNKWPRGRKRAVARFVLNGISLSYFN